MTSFSRDGAFASADVFDALLSTARGIGFSIPEPPRSSEDAQLSALIENLLQLVEKGSHVRGMRSALASVEHNRRASGLLDAEVLRRRAQQLWDLGEALEQIFLQKRAVLLRLMPDDAKKGIPVELKCQESFSQIIQSIAEDKYKLFEFIAEARELTKLNGTVTPWKAQLEALRGVHDQLATADRDLEDVSRLLKECTRAERSGPKRV